MGNIVSILSGLIPTGFLTLVLIHLFERKWPGSLWAVLGANLVSALICIEYTRSGYDFTRSGAYLFCQIVILGLTVWRWRTKTRAAAAASAEDDDGPFGLNLHPE